jgi:hypothetical protein
MRSAASADACRAARQAFDVIGNRDKGVVDLLWRQVDCGRKNSVTRY